jgi:hypothetical protein
MAEFTAQVLDRLYDVEFTPPILRESERELGRPIVASVRDDRGWRGFTYDEIETLLWVQVRRQNKRLTRPKFQAQLDQHLSEKRGTIQEWHLALIQAFNACELWFRPPEAEETNGDGEARAADDARPSVSSVTLSPPSLSVVSGTSVNLADSTGGSTS